MAKGFKTGGRARGVVNKVTESSREDILELCKEYRRGQFALDFAAVDPSDRLRMYLELMKLVTPKPPQIIALDNEERPIFTALNLDVEQGSSSILNIDPLENRIQFVFTDMSGESELNNEQKHG